MSAFPRRHWIPGDQWKQALPGKAGGQLVKELNDCGTLEATRIGGQEDQQSEYEVAGSVQGG